MIKKLLLGIMLVFASSAVFAQVPANDLCENALPAACGDVITGNTTQATETGEFTDFCGTAQGSAGVWYNFMGTGDIVTVSLCNGTTYDSKIQVYSGNCFGPVCVAGNDDFCGLQSEVTFESDASTNYLIYIFGFGASTGDFSMEITCVPPPPPPMNDDCDMATVALTNPDESCTVVNPGALSGATASVQDNDCVGNANDDVWFQFVATNDIHIIQLNNIQNGVTDLVHAVYEGADCDNLTQISCSDPNESTLQNLTIGETYFIRIWSFQNSVLNFTTFDLCIQSFFPPPPPANDECDDAINVDVNADDSCDLTTSGTLTGATDSQQMSACPGSGDDDVWFEFTATNSAHQVSLLNINGDVTDLVHAVYSGDCGMLTELYCSDANTSQSSDFVVGDTYFVRVYSFTADAFQEVDFDICINTFDTVLINPISSPFTALDPEELIEQVFVEQGGCGSVDINFVQLIENPAGATDLAQRSWGYFEQGTSTFPLEDGIILSSGFVESGEGPNDATGTSNSGFPWTGDPDIQAILDNQYGTTVATNNATAFVFEFTSNLPAVTFDFIFASEEYEDQFECSDTFRDGFAFLVSGPGIPDTSGAPFGGVNIASIEGSNNVPVSTFTIHRDTFLCGGEVEGTNYFPDLYVSNDAENTGNIPTQFDGLTTTLTTATIAIEPGEVYTIKLVIADRGDTAFDSAVFLAGGSFDLGEISLGDDITVTGGDAVCDGEDVTLTAGDFEDGVFEWQQDGMILTDESDSTLVVTEDGTYTVTITFPGTTCVLMDEIVVEFFPTPIVDLGPDQLNCSGGTITLDGTPSNLADLNMVTYEWFLDGVTIAGETNPTIDVMAAGTYSVEVTADGCVGTDDIIIDVVNFTVQIGGNVEFCGDESFTIIPEIVGEDATDATYLWSTGETTPTITVTTSGTYSVDVTIEGCTASDDVTLTFRDQPSVLINDGQEDFIKCLNIEETLVATVEGADNVTFKWFLDGGEIPGETTNTLSIMEGGTYAVEVNNDGCFASDSIFVGIYANENCVITQGLSPNGDGFNDNLDLEYLADRPGIDRLSIYNRYGSLVYEKEAYRNEWYGQDMEERILPVGTYFYVITLLEGEAMNGFIYINKEN